MAKSIRPVKSSPPKNFEEGLAELENIVNSMEEGQMPLEASLLAHKRGTELLQYCQATLQNAQQQIRILEANTPKDFSPTSIDER
ncbi:MAG: exodeoxyribonuclease VII small subunit [Nitrosomonadaceae bacterium]|nr:exodeoxyribonuclease VII small subunit [Nitrosomonadaceae bacterium]|tara:strand:- start:412 stop:666 length:255 start_codon:yes stop_codon:yes gene_type:complete